MKIELRPDHERLIDEAIQAGGYQNADEVLERALALLRSEDEWLKSQRPEIEAKLERALQQFERGEYFSPEKSREDMERRKAAWLAGPRP